MDSRRRWSSPQSEILCEVVIFWFSWSESFIVVEKWKFAKKSTNWVCIIVARSCKLSESIRCAKCKFVILEDDARVNTTWEATPKSWAGRRIVNRNNRWVDPKISIRQSIWFSKSLSDSYWHAPSIDRTWINFPLSTHCSNHKSLNEPIAEQSTKSICYHRHHHRHQQQAQLFGFPFGFPRPKLHFRFIEHEFMFDHRFN